MGNSVAQTLTAWQSFYSIIGTSAGALVGLQFVVIALLANTRSRADMQSINAFGTPNVVHFSGALVVSAVMSAPWRSLWSLSFTLGSCALLGLLYACVVFRRTSRQTGYKPVAEDWFWYVIMPFVMNATLGIAALLIGRAEPGGLFAVAAATLGLLLVGLRNAWDSVTHMVVSHTSKTESKE